MSDSSYFRLEIILVSLLVLILAWSIYKKGKPRREKNRTEKFLVKNPTASKLYLQDKGMQILLINNKAPYEKIENGEYVAFLLTGENVVDIVYQQLAQEKIAGTLKKQNEIENAKISFVAQSGKKYKVLYNSESGLFEVEEEGE